jgi:hypothetical protein
MPKLADFDAPTQERATGAFQQFLASYKLSASLFSADDLGAAVEAATRGHGSADPGFKERLFDGLYRALHRHMGELAARAQRVPSGLDAAAYDKLQRTLVSRFGALPAGSGAAGTVEEGKVRAPGSASIGEVLAGRAGPPSPIDVSVAAALRSGESGSSAPTRPDRGAGSAPARPDEVLYVYRITETATGRAVELGVPGKKLPAGANLYTDGPLGVDLVNNLKRLLSQADRGRCAVMGGALLPVSELATLVGRPGAVTVSPGPVRIA